MFEPAAGPVKSARKFQLLSVLSLQEQVNWLYGVPSSWLVIDACLLVLNQYVTVECNQSIFMIKTRIDTFLS